MLGLVSALVALQVEMLALQLLWTTSALPPSQGTEVMKTLFLEGFVSVGAELKGEMRELCGCGVVAESCHVLLPVPGDAVQVPPVLMSLFVPSRAAMAILFAVVARGTTILAKHAWCGGNFLEVTEQILAKIPSENNKLTYSHGR